MFEPQFKLTPALVKILIEIEALKQEIDLLPLTPKVLAGLRETAKLSTIHYSTMIEGNRLTQEEVNQVINYKASIKNKNRDEKEVLGYFAALDYLEKLVKEEAEISQKIIKTIHALVMAAGKQNVKPTPYRDGQNVIREGLTHKIVYLPPEAKDVPILMKDLVSWLNESEEDIPCPVLAAIAHYELATIHPYYDGNGRTARLLTTIVLHLCGYGLKGLYSLDEYYAKDLQDYYKAISIGSSHNYYEGRAQADITSWIEYFCRGMLNSFTNVKNQALTAFHRGEKDKSVSLRKLDVRKRKVMPLFENFDQVSSLQIADFLKISPRTARALCQKWVNESFLEISDKSKKSRKYTLHPNFASLISV